MNIKQIENILIDSGIEPSEAKAEVRIMLEHFLGFSSVDIALAKEFDSHEVLKAAKRRAETKEPIQHILGEAYFMGEKFKVSPSVLIPRDETEILVREVISKAEQYDFKKGLDIGTGSGCIACMVAKNTNVQMLGVDVSTDALQIALDNASALNLNNKAIFRKADLFEKIHSDEKFDFIVSNPPYIPPFEKLGIQKEVSFEPDLALYTKDSEGVEFYERIAYLAPNYLNKGGYLFFELGINQSAIVAKFLLNSGFGDVEIVKDLAGIDRVIQAKLL